MSYSSSDPVSGISQYLIGLVTNPGQDWLTLAQADGSFGGVLTNLDLTQGQVFYIGIRTENGAGAWSAIGYSQAITVDTIPPVLSFTLAGSTIVLNKPPINIGYTLSKPATVQFTLTAADGSVQTCNATGQAGMNYFTFQAGVPETYQLAALPADPAGNIGAAAVQSIRVNAPPQINLPASFDTTPDAPLQLTAAVTDPDGYPVSYSWNPGDGGAPVSGAAPTYQYTTIGSYTLTLTVTDNDGGITTTATTVNVHNTFQGKLFTNETWSGTWYLYGDVTVPPGITLTILPGTQIIVNSDPFTGNSYTLDIQGNLTIPGAGQVSFSSPTGQAGDWKGIYVEGQATLNQVLIQDAARGLAVVNGAAAMITNCTFQNNQAGLHVYGAQPTVTNCSFINNTLYGIKEDNGGRPIVTGSLFSGNGIDYYSEIMTGITIDQLNQINGNSGNQCQ